MATQGVKFKINDRPEFYRVLNKRVNQYFKEKNISKHANLNMKLKTVFMLTLYFTPLILLLSGTVTSFLWVTITWCVMGLGMAGIGLSVMHDANHGAYSDNKTVNSIVGFVINFVGGYHVNWKIQHNVLHHSFTNIHDHDEDIDKGVMRFSPNQERKPIFKFQLFYAPFLYGLMTIYWFLVKDFQLLVRYREKELLEGQGVTFGGALLQVLFHKSWYIFLTLVLPLMIVPLPWYQTIVGFFLMHFICGLILALIFQPAHVIEDTNFFKTDEEGSVENHWAIHQLKTTCNFANDSTFFSWFIGGLNFQIEHHLFPHICHVHYKGISKIVKSTAEEFDLPYYQHKTFYSAVKSHFTLLHLLGTGKYDSMAKTQTPAPELSKI